MARMRWNQPNSVASQKSCTWTVYQTRKSQEGLASRRCKSKSTVPLRRTSRPCKRRKALFKKTFRRWRQNALRPPNNICQVLTSQWSTKTRATVKTTVRSRLIHENMATSQQAPRLTYSDSQDRQASVLARQAKAKAVETRTRTQRAACSRPISADKAMHMSLLSLRFALSLLPKFKSSKATEGLSSAAAIQIRRVKKGNKSAFLKARRRIRVKTKSKKSRNPKKKSKLRS